MSVRSAAKPKDANPAPVQQAQNLPSVLVAKVSLPAGSFVQPDQLEWQAWPSNNISTAYIKKGAQGAEMFAGAVVRSGIAAGEPITEGRLVKKDERGFMAAVLTPGMRAVSVLLNDTSGISGFVFPGDKVDVILTQAIKGVVDDKQLHRASETVLQDIRVLAVDQRTDDQKPEAKPAKTATLEVTPKQAEALSLIADLGKISLSLRSLGSDPENIPPGPKDVSSYTWDSEASPLLGITQKSQVTTIVRGSSAEDVVLNNSKGGT